jgi:hypothetical protein
MPVWRRDGTGRSYALKLTAAGLKAIAVDDGSKEAIAPNKETQPQLQPNPDAIGEHAKTLMPRGGSKLARLIDLLQRSEGASQRKHQELPVAARRFPQAGRRRAFATVLTGLWQGWLPCVQH